MLYNYPSISEPFNLDTIIDGTTFYITISNGGVIHLVRGELGTGEVDKYG